MRVTWLALEWPRPGFHSGGVGRYVARMARRVAQKVDLTVVTLAGAEEYPGMRFVKIPAPKGRFDRYYRSAWRAKAAVASTMPDLVHAHGDDFLLSGSTPIVRTFYGLSLSEARSSSGLRRINHYVLAGLERWAARRAVARLGIAVEAVEHFDCDGLFPPYFGASPVTPRQPSATPTIVFIGSFQGRKQGWLAQRAVASLRRHEAWRAARLIVVGPKQDALNWEPWVQHRSGLADGEVSELLSSAWLLVSPSSYEGFGIPIVEALAHDVAVVAIDNPGSSYIRSQAEPAVPLTLTDQDGFSECVAARIAQGPGLAAEEAAAARGVVSRLTRDGSPERLVEIYAEVVTRKGSVDGAD
jgi:glycosyltransferase involved in cell wall biosynthesis